GAAVWLYLQDFLQARLGLGATWALVLGVIFVLLVCFLRRGIMGGFSDAYDHLTGRNHQSQEPEPDAAEGAAGTDDGAALAAAPQRRRGGSDPARPMPHVTGRPEH